MIENKQNIREILRRTRVEIAPETFYIVSFGHADWLKLLEKPELSPRMTAPFMIFRDKFETTLVLDEIDFQKIRGSVNDPKAEGNFRLLTFDVELDFTIVGFLAKIAVILAEAEIPIVALSAFSRDHLLVKQKDLSKALKTLSPFIDEIC